MERRGYALEAINFLSNWITWLLVLVPAGAGLTIGYFAACKAFTDDQGSIADYNKKIWFTLKAAIIIESVSGFVTVVKAFYI